MMTLTPSMAVSESLFASQSFLANVAQYGREAAVLGDEGAEIQAMAGEALQGRLDTGLVADRVWRRLAIHFGRSIPGCEVIEGETVELRTTGSEFLVFDPINMLRRLRWIDQLLGGGLHLVESGQDDTLLLQFPRLTRIESAARHVFGVEAASWYYVPGEIAKAEANEGHRRRRQHIALPLKPQFLEEAGGKVAELPYAVHDLTHAADVAGIHPEFLMIAVTLGDTLFALPDDYQALEYVQVQLHEIAELSRVHELTLGQFMKSIFLPWEHEVRDISRLLIPRKEREQRAALGRAYVDRVFDGWLPRLSGDRREYVERYRNVLDSHAERILRQP